MLQKFIPSPNFNDRRNGKTPQYIILHYTDTPTTQMALDDYLLNPDMEASAHYVIEKDGNILQLVEDEKRAWHAGKSFWRGEADMNSASIGIEIVNPGHTYGHEPFPPEQIAAVIQLCQDKMENFAIPPENILAHSDIAPSRKEDPGHLFPWAELAKHGVGIWPHPAANQNNLKTLDEALIAYGYDPAATPEERIAAFHRRFAPENLQKP